MKIQVTQQHIQLGLRGSCTADPIALALKDAGFMRPWVSPTRIETVGQNGGYMKENWSCPQSVLSFMIRFDRGEVVSPFEFELEGV